MKFIFLLTALLGVSNCHVSKKPFQQFSSFFGSNCDQYEDNPILLSSTYNEQCDDYDGQCMEFPESNTSGSLSCKKSISLKPQLYGPQDYFTLHFYLKSTECKGKEKTQALQMRASGACIPDMNGDRLWIQALCGDNGVHYYTICDDEDCNSCNDPYYLQENQCYVTQGLTDNYSVSVSCTSFGQDSKKSTITSQTRKTFQKKVELESDLFEVMSMN
jgi:hypothetical protein